MVKVTVERVRWKVAKVTIGGKRARKITVSSRQIFATRDYVVKVDWPAHGGQGADEVSKWNIIDRKDRHYFAPVVASGEGWVCMKRYRGRHLAPEWAHHVIRGISEKYGLCDLHTWSWSPDGPPARLERIHNWMMTREGPIIYDYGM